MLRNQLKRLNEHIEGHPMLDAFLGLMAGLFFIMEIATIILLLERP